MKIGVIPARLNSSRIEKKVFKKIGDKTILEHTINKVKELSFLDRFVVATDSQDIADLAISLRVEPVLDKSEVWCGSQRLYHVYKKYPYYDWYISIPVDEPFILPKEINYSVESTELDDNKIYTMYYIPRDQDAVRSESTCKIVSTPQNEALYFSRNIIPINKSGNTVENFNYKRHLGIFFISKNMIVESNKIWRRTPLATIESLEQNAFIENGYTVKLIKTKHTGKSIDTAKDLTND